MQRTDFFNLIAALISDGNKYKEIESPKTLTKEWTDVLVQKVDKQIESSFGDENILSYDTLPYSLRDISDIMDWLKVEDNYYLYRMMICRLDSLVDIDTLVHDYDVNNISSENTEHIFQGLNDNIAETGVIILPKVYAVKTEYVRRDKDGKDKSIVRKDADYWMDDLNKHLNNLYYVKMEQLEGYKINNVIFSLPKEKINSNFINIGVTPICKVPMLSLIKINDNIINYDEQGNESRSFSIEGIKEISTVENNYMQSYYLACDNDIDIFVAPEMLGTEKLTESDEYGFNDCYMGNAKSPFLILAPTIWKDNSNVLNVFSKSGELLGKQYKQYPYEYKGTFGNCQENLVNTPREILLIHMPGVGRIAFSVCVDFLHPDYRRKLISVLKSTLLICPSYSMGSANFEKSIDSGTEFDVRCVWLNSCSAIEGLSEPPDYIGVVSMPIVSETSPRTRIKPTCRGNCGKGCLFKIRMPLNCAGDSLHEDLNVDIGHIVG